MENLYQTTPYQIIDVKDESPIIKRFKLRSKEGSNLIYEPGQIVFVSIPGFGEAPFAPCGNSSADYLELCIRKAGRVTDKIHSLGMGEKVGLRGPYGKGWPTICHPEPRNRHPELVSGSLRDRLVSGSHEMPKQVRDDDHKNLLVVVGGLGLIPVRTLLLDKDRYLGPDAKIQLFYGAKHPSEFLFKDDYKNWQKNGVDLQLTIDKECPEWDGCVGVVTVLFDKHKITEDSSAFLVGPPIMYKFVLQKLQEKKFPENDIYMSLERRMHCGIGVCQHCAIGSFYTCKDGPVFKYKEIKDVEGAL